MHARYVLEHPDKEGSIAVFAHWFRPDAHGGRHEYRFISNFTIRGVNCDVRGGWGNNHAMFAGLREWTIRLHEAGLVEAISSSRRKMLDRLAERHAEAIDEIRDHTSRLSWDVVDPEVATKDVKRTIET